LSEHSLRSANVVKEVSIASEFQRAIIPIELEPIVLTDDFIYQLAGLQRTSIANHDAIIRALAKFGLLSLPEGENTRPQLKDTVYHETHQRLAVLPFEDHSPGKDNEWFADGMTDELISTLSKIEQLKVNPRGDVMYYKQNRPKLADIAIDLKCRYIVEGRVQKVGEKIRISVTLSDAREHSQVWSERYNGTFEDIFDLQDSTSLAIAEALKLKLTPGETADMLRRNTDNSEAYELFLKGLDYFRRQSLPDMESALAVHLEAIRLDPNFATAHCEAANCYIELYTKHRRDEKLLKLAEEQVNIAEQIGTTVADVYRLRCQIASWHGNYEEAIRLGTKATEIDPNFALAYYALGITHFMNQHPKEASIQFKRYAELRPNDRSGRFNYVGSLSMIGDFESRDKAAREALPVLERHLRFIPDDTSNRANYILLLSWAGEPERALHEAEKMLRMPGATGQALFNLAALFEEHKQNDRALEAYRLSVERGFREINSFQGSVLNDDPEYQQIVKLLEQKIAEEKSNA